jgi:hypothetical protein
VTGANALYDIGQDFNFQSTVNNNLANTGSATILVRGNFLMNSTASLVMATASTAGVVGTLEVRGNFTFTAGTITELHSNTGRGVIRFSGTTTQTFSRGGSSVMPSGTNLVDFDFEPNSIVNLGTSILTTGTGSTTTMDGRIGLGATDGAGALQNNTTGGNIRTPTAGRTIGTTASFEFNGTAAQFISAAHVNSAGVDVIINNSNGVTQTTSVTIAGDLTLQSGNLTTGPNNSLNIGGNLSLPSGSLADGNLNIGSGATLTLNGNSTNNANNYVALQLTSNLVINGSGAFGVFPFQAGSTPAFGSFTLNRTPSGSVTFDNDVSITGNTTLSNGNLIFNGRQLTLVGQFSATGSGNLSGNNTSTLEIAGSVNTGTLQFASGGETLNTLSINKTTGNVTLGSAIILTNALDLLGGTLINTGGITVNDNVVVTRDSDSEITTNGFTNAPGDSYDLIYLGSSTYTTGVELPDPLDDEDLNNLTIDGNTVQLDQNLIVNGTVTLQSGELAVVSGNITMEGSSWLANGGTFTPGTGEVVFPATTTVGGNTTAQLGTIQITSTGNVTFPGAASVNISGDINVVSGGVLTSLGTIMLNGSLDQSVNVGGTTIFNMTVDKANESDVFLTSPMSMTGLLNILSTNTNFNSNGNLTILSSADEDFGVEAIGVAPLLFGASVTGDVTVQRYMSGENRIWRYISSPIADATVADLMDDFPVTGPFDNPSTGTGIISENPSFYFYDETFASTNPQSGWVVYPSSGAADGNPLLPGVGYSAFIREGLVATVWDVTGPINQGTISLPVSYTDTGTPEADGWNLVGNPYPCTIFWSDQGWNVTNIAAGIAVRDNGGGGGTFQVWDGEVGNTDTFSGDIGIGQGFWVYATGENPVLEIDETAKAPINGTFFKKSTYDYIELVLKKDTWTDRAYFRQRKNAAPGKDRYDLPKLSNDYYSLAVRTDDNFRMSISASNTIPCGGKLVLDLSFAKNSNGSFVRSPSGTYNLYLNQFGLFGANQVQLADKFTGTRHTFQADQPYTFMVTANAQSYRADRFELYVNETVPMTNLELRGSGIVCADQIAVIIIENAQTDVEYQAFINGVAVSIPQAGEGHNLNLLVPNDSLNAGVNVVSIKALNGCASYDLAQSFTISKENAYTIASVASTEVCQNGSVTLTASGAPANGVYKWYDKESDVTALSESASSEFITPELSKPETFYVAITNSLGCEGPRIAVKANVINYDEATITSERVNELKSNYAENNTWYFNGTELDEHEQIIHAKESGIYRLEVTVSGCTTSAEQEYIVTGPAQERSEVVFGAYPNPVEDILVIEGVADVNSVKMMNVTGAEMKLQWIEKTENALRLWVGDLQSGIYYVSAREGNNKRRTLKIIRR